MQLLKRSEKSDESPKHPTLPTLSDAETAEIVAQAKRYHHNLSRCPTCKAGHNHPVYEDGPHKGERVPGVDLGWRTDSTYVFDGEEIVCDCEWQDELRRRYLLADIPGAYWRLGKDDYYGDPEAWNVAQGYLDHWDEYREVGLGLEFHSRTQGTGKTFLLTYVARQLIQRGESVYFIPFRDIISLYQEPYEVRKPIERRLRDSTVLALDEVGKAISGSQGDLWAMKFEELMRDRIDAGVSTLMSTNLGPDELDKLYTRTYSLLAANQKRWAINLNDMRREGVVYDILHTLAERKEKRPIR